VRRAAPLISGTPHIKPALFLFRSHDSRIKGIDLLGSHDTDGPDAVTDYLAFNPGLQDRFAAPLGAFLSRAAASVNGPVPRTPTRFRTLDFGPGLRERPRSGRGLGALGF